MRCDNHCLQCGTKYEFINNNIFECPSVLQTWVLTATLSSFLVFSILSLYINMDYLFYHKNNIEDSKMDRYPYP